MNKDIIVFAAKSGGLELVNYLLEINAPLSQVVVASEKDQEIINVVSSQSIPVAVYNSDLTLQLIKEGNTYNWLLNLWSPHILRGDILSLAGHRLNIHPSYVPCCQGNDNAAWTIRESAPAGVSLIEMNESIDGGDVYIQKKVDYSFPVKGKDLNGLLIKEAGSLFRKYWPKIYSGEIKAVKQEGIKSYHTRKDTEQDRVLDASAKLTIGECITWMLAHDFFPGTTAEVKFSDKRYRVTLSIDEMKGDK